jgi:hypothetical protein
MSEPAVASHRDRRIGRVLEIDPDLGVDLAPEALESATADLVVPLVQVEWAKHRGAWGPSETRGCLGLLIVEGLLFREVELLTTCSAEVLGAGDVLRPWDVAGDLLPPVPAEVDWSALAPVHVAVLTRGFAARAARFPEVLARLAGRGVARAKALALHDALTNLKHVETRLLVQFWHLAERWGRVGRDDISIPVPLTHEMLAQLVGATRPSVTTGLGHLATRGLVLRDDAVWRLSHDSREALEPLPLQPDTRLQS